MYHYKMSVVVLRNVSQANLILMIVVIYNSIRFTRISYKVILYKASCVYRD